MKKKLILLALVVLLMMPLASLAKTTISDSDLDTVTAQDSISIDLTGYKVSDVRLKTAWFKDADGFEGATNPGYLGTINFSINGEVVAFNGIVTVKVIYNAGITKVSVTLPTVTVGGTNGATIDQEMVMAEIETDLLTSTRFRRQHMEGVKATIGGVIKLSAHQ